MPAFQNGKTKENRMNDADLDAFVQRVIESGSGMIAGARYHDPRKDTDRYTYWDMSNVTVEADANGDDMFMVNYQNGMSWSAATQDDLLPTLRQYLRDAINMHSSSKATVRVLRNGAGMYELDNMRAYTSLQDAKRAGYANRSEYVHSVATGRDLPI